MMMVIANYAIIHVMHVLIINNVQNVNPLLQELIIPSNLYNF